jgi:hypothetical protein
VGPPRIAPGRLVVALAAALLAVAGACQADLPDLLGGDGSLAVPCSPFADLVIEYKPGGGDNDPAAGMPALGGGDGAGVAITVNTVLTVGFLGLGAVTDGEGADFGIAVVAVPEPDTQVAGYTSVDGETFEYAGDLTAETTTLDLGLLAGTPSASYVRVVGIAGALEIDAIEAIQETCPTAR